MSEIKRIIELTPNEYSKVEGFVSDEMECKKCRGSGGWSYEVQKNKVERELCPICNGTGYVVAEVVITWKGVEKQK